MSNIKELKLQNKKFAEHLVAFLNEKNKTASLQEKDGNFVVSYELKADAEQKDCIDEKLSAFAQYIFNALDNQANYMYRQIDEIWNWVYNHNNGHLPALTPSGLAKLIKTAGQEDDYKVVPRTIYASQEGIEFGTTELKAALTKIKEKDDVGADADVSRLLAAIKAQKK